MTIYDLIRVLPNNYKFSLCNDPKIHDVGHILQTASNHKKLLDLAVGEVDRFKDVVIIRSQKITKKVDGYIYDDYDREILTIRCGDCLHQVFMKDNYCRNCGTRLGDWE